MSTFTTAQWVRLALTGDEESTKVSSTKITMLEAGAKQELISQSPTCLDGAPDSLVEEVDQDAFTEALGYRIAAKIVMMPGGTQFAQFVTSTKIGPVTKTRQDPSLTASEASQALLDASSAALRRIECVLTALSSMTTMPVLSLVGHRRSSCGCK